MTIEDRMSSLRDYWGAYHHHKEQMAFAATALYLGAATAIVFKAGDFWPKDVPHWLIVKLMLASVVVAFSFVIWQLRNREIAADIVGACSSLLSDDLETTSRDDGKKRGTWRGVPLPGIVVERIDELSRTGDFLSGPKMAAWITYAAMAAWTLGAAIALMHAA